MPDPFDQLSDFDPGPPMNPLPPSDVRRRGDRMRRRNNVLTGVGAVLAVGVIATPLALAGTGERSERPEPAPAPSPSVRVDWQQTIPAGFPLEDGMALDPDIPATVGDDLQSAELVQATINLCGEDAWSRRPANDLLGAAWSDGVEGGEQRTLAVYPSDADAETAQRRIEDAVTACPEDGGSGFPVVPLEADEGDAAVAFVEQYPRDDDGRSYLVVRIGNALLLDHTYVPAGGDTAEAQAAVDDLAARAHGVIKTMCVFSADRCGG